MSASTVLLLTSAFGFVALHVLDALLSQAYNVVVAVRSPSREGDVRTVAKPYPNSKVSFVYVPDISADSVYDGVFKTHSNIKAIIHTSSPVNFSSEVLIKNVVEPAILMVVPMTVDVEKPSPKGAVIKLLGWMSLWRTAKGVQWIIYTVSKILAEKALWKFVEEESHNLEVTTLLPCIAATTLLQ
jgi:nucleoside-diphosphate-sugar epimerase